MHKRKMLSIGLSALALAGVGVGTAATFGMTAFAGGASQVDAKKAEREAQAARKALTKRKIQEAVAHAEASVALDPRNAENRALLGQVYLMAGRFTSAGQALADTLTLDPANGRAALNLALAQIGTGDWSGARKTLDDHADHIPASDRGLAYALAGDPGHAVEVLSTAARVPGADAKTRQNLALSLALAGRWPEAKAVASVDVAPDQVDARIMQWATFSKPRNAYDQVASLLGVTVVQDGGQPVALALNQTMQAVAAVAATVDPTGTEAPAVAETPAAEPAPVAVAAAEPAPAPVAAPAVETAKGVQVVFAPRKEIVQAIPVAVAAASPRAVKVAKPALAAAAPALAPVAVAKASAPAKVSAPAKGTYFVQLGAYENAAVAHDAWRRLAGTLPAVGQQTPQGMNVSTKAGNFYRLSVGGFAKQDATSLCGAIKAKGGSCFVRTGAGETAASWAKGTAVASR